jgi:hypothetical protein
MHYKPCQLYRLSLSLSNIIINLKREEEEAVVAAEHIHVLFFNSILRKIEEKKMINKRENSTERKGSG